MVKFRSLNELRPIISKMKTVMRKAMQNLRGNRRHLNTRLGDFEFEILRSKIGRSYHHKAQEHSIAKPTSFV